MSPPASGHAVPEFYIDACCWHPQDWQMAAESSVQDATEVTRAQAQERFAREVGEPWIEVGVWKRYVRPFDRQEQYEWWVEHNDWRDDETGGGWEEHPQVAPDDWQPDPYDEDLPYWQLCLADHPNARAVWICGLRKDGAPHDPRRTNA